MIPIILFNFLMNNIFNKICPLLVLLVLFYFVFIERFCFSTVKVDVYIFDFCKIKNLIRIDCNFLLFISNFQ